MRSSNIVKLWLWPVVAVASCGSNESGTMPEDCKDCDYGLCDPDKIRSLDRFTPANLPSEGHGPMVLCLPDIDEKACMDCWQLPYCFTPYKDEFEYILGGETENYVPRSEVLFTPMCGPIFEHGVCCWVADPSIIDFG